MDKETEKLLKSMQSHLQEAFELQGGRCYLCGAKMFKTQDMSNKMRATADHIIPRSKGGRNHRKNIKAAHSRCNELKGNMSLYEWFQNREKLIRESR